MDQYINGNREAWNMAARYHEKAKGKQWLDHFKIPGHTCFDSIERELYGALPLQDASVFQAPCNNGRELLSLMNMGASEGVGFDLSDENIRFANQLRDASGTCATFIRANVYEIPDTYNDRFDIGIITTGSIMWMPDLKAYFEVYARLLKKGGTLLIYEMHPLTTVFRYSFAKQADILFQDSYFEKNVMVDCDSLDYIGQVEYKSPPQYNFQYTMADIIQTLIDLGYTIMAFKEYPHDSGGGHGYLEGKVPLTYHLLAVNG